MSLKDAPGTVYLVHISDKLHYTGWTEGPLEERIADHRATDWIQYPEPRIDANGTKRNGEKVGSGATILGVANSRGWHWEVVRTWQGTRAVERRLKNLKGARSYCPACRGAAALTRANYDEPVAEPAPIAAPLALVPEYEEVAF